MTYISRRLPTSSISRELAINAAHTKMGIVLPADMALSAATQDRLNAMKTEYDTKLSELAAAKAALSQNTPLKDAAVASLRTYVSHFIQVFNLGVVRGKYNAAHRAYYQLDVNSAALPDLGTEANVKLWAGRLVTGDANRLDDGGTIMVNPDITEVDSELGTATTLLNTQNTLAEALDHKQEALEESNEKADTLIKRVWDEVETFYSEESPESKRNNARNWGVVYVSSGPGAVLTGLVKNPAGTPLGGVTVTLVESSATATTNPEGRYDITTKITGSATLRVTAGAPPVKYDITATIPEDHDGITVEVGDIVVG